jgi:cell division septation protein DedD
METNKRTQRIIGIILFASSIIGLIYFLSHQSAQIPKQEENFFLVQAATKAANEPQTPQEISTHETTTPQPTLAPIEPLNTITTTFEKPTELQNLEEPTLPSATNTNEDETTQTTSYNKGEATVTNLNDPIQATGDSPINEDALNPKSPMNQSQQTYPQESLQTQPVTATLPQPEPQESTSTTTAQPLEKKTTSATNSKNTTEQITQPSQPTSVSETAEQPQKEYWSVQFGVFRQQQLAQKMQHDLEQNYHLKTTLILKTNTQGKNLYHVILQPFFSSHTHALEASQAFKLSFHISSSLFHNMTLS